jgi:hypothetical protein
VARALFSAGGALTLVVLLAGCSSSTPAVTPTAPPTHDQQALVAFLTAYGFECGLAPEPLDRCERDAEFVDVYPPGYPVGQVSAEVARALGACDRGESPLPGFRVIESWPPCEPAT